MAGSEGSIFLFWNADSQPLFLGQSLHPRVQRADVAVMRWRGSNEVIQQEVTWQGDAWEHHQQEQGNLVTSESISFSQNVLELHHELKI